MRNLVCHCRCYTGSRSRIWCTCLQDRVTAEPTHGQCGVVLDSLYPTGHPGVPEDRVMGHWDVRTWECLGTEVQGHRGVWGQGSGTQEYRDTGNKPRCWAINAGASSPWSPYFHSTHRFFSSFQPSVDGFPLPTPAVPGEKPPSGFGTPRLGFSQGGAGKAPKPKDLVGRGNR